MRTTEELIKLTNSLSNDDLKFIINAFSERICVYAGSYKNHAISFGRVECTSNGCMIQINYADLGQDTFDIKKLIKSADEYNSSHIEFNQNALDNILSQENLDWSFDEPDGSYCKVYIFENKDSENEDEDED